METDWFRPRKYKHFDRPVSERFAEKVMEAEFVEKNSFTPLIKYFKETRKYKSIERKTRLKKRPIMYASHRDACILSFYSKLLGVQLEQFYSDNNLTERVIAYRALGQGCSTLLRL
jgi:RNA-directed DNA polymerase